MAKKLEVGKKTIEDDLLSRSHILVLLMYRKGVFNVLVYHICSTGKDGRCKASSISYGQRRCDFGKHISWIIRS
jgi:hypothetical protein